MQFIQIYIFVGFSLYFTNNHGIWQGGCIWTVLILIDLVITNLFTYAIMPYKFVLTTQYSC